MNKDPISLGKSLFNEESPELNAPSVCSIIGANGEFYKKILTSFMDCFDFSGISLDEAFRYYY